MYPARPNSRTLSRVFRLLLTLTWTQSSRRLSLCMHWQSRFVRNSFTTASAINAIIRLWSIFQENFNGIEVNKAWTQLTGFTVALSTTWYLAVQIIPCGLRVMGRWHNRGSLSLLQEGQIGHQGGYACHPWCLVYVCLRSPQLVLWNSLRRKYEGQRCVFHIEETASKPSEIFLQ